MTEERKRDSRPASILVQRRIEWSDTDASGAYHNSAAFSFIEVAEAALLDRLGMLAERFRLKIANAFTVPASICGSATGALGH